MKKKQRKGELRKRAKYPGLDKRVNARTRHEYIDFDYVDKLSDKEKEWLSNFNEEFMSGNFQHKGKIFHKSKKSKRECYSRNNARNRDASAIAMATGHLQQLGDESHLENILHEKMITKHDAIEDVLIDVIDFENAGIDEQVINEFLEEPLKKKRNKLNSSSKTSKRKKKLSRSV